VAAADALSASVATVLPVMRHLTARVVAAPGASVSAAGASTDAGRVPRHVSDGLFTALGQALAAQMGAAGSAQANLDNLFWKGEDSSWLDGGCEWLL
jgi:hypothetical protein